MLLGLLLALGQVPAYAPRDAWGEEAIRWLHEESDAWARGSCPDTDRVPVALRRRRLA